MTSLVASLPWGAPVSMGYLASVNVAAVYLPFVLVALAILAGVARFWMKPHQFTLFLAQLFGAMFLARFVLIPLIRLFVQTVRPYALLGFDPLIGPVMELSFPSAHTAVMAAVAFVVWRFRPSAGAALLLGAVIIGIARVFAGVHWPVDIIGGVFVGGAAALMAIYWRNLFGRRR